MPTSIAGFLTGQTLFYFAFAENHVLPRTWVVFFQFQLLRLGARVFFGHVKVASISGTYEFNLKGRWLRHDTYSLTPCDTFKLNILALIEDCQQLAVKHTKCQACVSVFLICLIVAWSPFCERLMMIAGVGPPALVLAFYQFCRHPPNLAKCHRKQRSLQ